MNKYSFLLVLVISIAMIMGCGSGDDTEVVVETPSAVSAPVVTEQPIVEPTPLPETTDVASDEGDKHDEHGHDDKVSAYPVTVTDMMGREVEIKSEPTNIVGISPTAMEMLYRVGGEAVGRDNSSTWNPVVEALPSVGGAYSPSMEAIIGLQPDLIIIEALTQGHLVDMLAGVGAPIVAVRATSVDDVTHGLTLLGKVINKEDKARIASNDIEKRIESAVSSLEKSRSVLILTSDADRNIYAALPNSYAGAIAGILTLDNVAANLSESGPYPGYALFSSEQAIASNPEIILTISPAPAPAPKLSTTLPMVPGYAGLDAVIGGRVSEVSVDLFLQAPGPRIANAVEELNRIINDMYVSYPVTVTDMMGREVEIKSEPTNIVGISPTAMEMLYRVGGEAVGRDNSSTWNPVVEALPSVGGAYSPSMEAIIGLQPDLIIIEALTQGHLVDMLAGVGAPIVAVRATSVDDVTHGLTLLGKVINKEDKARIASNDIEKRIESAVSSLEKSRSVLILTSDADRNIYAALPNSYAGAIAGILTLDNVAANLSESGPYPGYALFSSEQAIASNPEIILTISPAPAPAPKLSTTLPMVPGYAGLDAVIGGRVSEVSVDLFLQAPGPRIVDAVEELNRIIAEATFE